MSKDLDTNFLGISENILKKGKKYTNARRGVERTQLPTALFTHSFSDGFPALQLKNLDFRSVVAEFIWFLKGDTSIKYLVDNNVNIWNKDAHNWHKKQGGTLSLKDFIKAVKNGEDKGDTGKSYPYQWRNCQGKLDQFQQVIDDMKKDIMGSRNILMAWNPLEVNETALPPCHFGFQIIGVPLENGEFGFVLKWFQRAWDYFLGAPFNIASYALVAKFLEEITGHKALGIETNSACVHYYDNQYNVAGSMNSRVPQLNKVEIKMPELDYKNTPLDELIDQLEIQDFKLIGYKGLGELRTPMIAPKNI